MAIPYPIDPSLPSNPNPLFSDAEALRGDHMRANNDQIWSNILYIVNTILGGAVLSLDGTMAGNSDVLFPSEKAVRTYIAAYINAMLPIGSEMYWPGITPPTNWLVRDGSSLLRSSYTSLFSALAPVTSGLTMTLANPCVLTLNNHGLRTYQCMSLETSAGGLPSIFTAGANLYVHVIDVNTFHVCSSIGNVTAGNYISTLGLSQSGVHSLRYSSYGTADLTHFNLPDDRGVHIIGTGIQGTASGWAGSLANHVGVQGYYGEDQMQQITGSFEVRYGNDGGRNIQNPLGVFTEAQNGTAMSTITSSATARAPHRVSFDSANSPDARTGAITEVARVGHLPIIKYQ